MKISVILKIISMIVLINVNNVSLTSASADESESYELNIDTYATTSSAVTVDNYAEVTNVAEFINALNHKKNIKLSNDIVIDGYNSLSTTTPLTIDMNSFQIIVPAASERFDGKMIEFDGPFTFENAPSSAPMFTIEAGSLADFSNGVCIKVDSDNSTGIQVSENASLNFFDSSINISADNCIGINSADNIDPDNSDVYIANSDIEVNGNNSIGIQCIDLLNLGNKTVHLFYDKITSNSDNSKTVDSDNVISDCSYLDPVPENTTYITRKISDFFNGTASHKQLSVNSDSNDLVLPHTLYIYLENTDDSSDIMQLNVPVNWIDNVDYNTIGTYTIDGTLNYKYPEITPFESLVSNSITVDIKDPNIFDLSFISDIAEMNDNHCYVNIEFLKELDDSQNNKLYYSLDQEATWQEYDYNNYSLSNNHLTIDFLELNTDYRFKYILEDGTCSNILELLVDSNLCEHSSIHEGDRDFGDLGASNPGNNNNSNGSSNDTNNSTDSESNNESSSDSNGTIDVTSSSNSSKKHNNALASSPNNLPVQNLEELNKKDESNDFTQTNLQNNLIISSNSSSDNNEKLNTQPTANNINSEIADTNKPTMSISSTNETNIQIFSQHIESSSTDSLSSENNIKDNSAISNNNNDLNNSKNQSADNSSSKSETNSNSELEVKSAINKKTILIIMCTSLCACSICTLIHFIKRRHL